MSVQADFDASGIWSGIAELAGSRLAVTSHLDDASGALSGVLFFGDPDVGQMVGVGPVTGQRTADSASWQTTAGAVLAGTFDPDAFAGTLTLPRPAGGTVEAALQLTRLPRRRERFRPIAPQRLADTRELSSEPLEPGTVIPVPVTGVAGIPYEGVAAVVVNITGTEARGPGYVTAWASGHERPGTANLNLEREGQTAGNLAIVPVGDDGWLQLFAQNGTHLVVDAFGWFSTSSILERASSPTGVLDTRAVSYIGYAGSKPGPETSVRVSLAAAGACLRAVSPPAILNIVATEADAPGYVTAWASGRPPQFTANLNVDAAGQTIGNLAIVPVGDDGSIMLFTQSGTHFVADLFGWFPIEQPIALPARPAGPDGSVVADGSFEAFTTIESQPSFRSIDAGSTIGAWIVTEGGVDLVGPAQAVAADGEQFLDLNGNNAAAPGAIEQLVPTSPDRQYEVAFMMAGNPNGAPVVKQVEVTFGDGRHTYSFDTTGRTNEALGWTRMSFVANPDCGSSTSLVLRSLTSGDRGPNIDAVTVRDVGPTTGCNLGGFRSIDPSRLLDTRAASLVGYAGEKPGPGSVVRVQVAGVAGIGSGSVAAVAVNLTATEATGAGYITAWPSGIDRPLTASLNLEYVGQTRGNHAIVPVDSDGSISIFTQSGTHLVVDAFGWFS